MFLQLGLLIIGFFAFEWWTPPLALVASVVVGGICYRVIRLQGWYATLGFVLAVIATLLFIGTLLG